MESHAASGFGKYISFSSVTVSALFVELIKTKRLLVAGDPAIGMAAVMIVPAYFNTEVLQAVAPFWWIEPEHRKGGCAKELLKALEIRTKELGAVTLSVAALECASPESLGRFYEWNGYDLVDHYYCKVL